MTYSKSFFLGVSLTIFYSSFFYIFPALVKFWEFEFNLTISEMTLAFTISFLMQAIISPYFGKLLDKGYGYYVLIFSTVLGGLSLLLLSFTTNYIIFFISWILIGISSAGWGYDYLFPMLTILIKDKAKKFITIITIVAGFYGTFTFPIDNYLAYEFDSRIAIKFFVFLIFFIAIPLTFFSLNQYRFTANVIKKTINQNIEKTFFYKKINFWILTISLTSGFFIFSLYTTHILLILDFKNISTNQSILIASLIGPSQVLGRFIFMFFGKYLSNVLLYCLTTLFILISLIFIYFANVHIFFAFLFVFFYGIAHGTRAIISTFVQKDILGLKSFGKIRGYISLICLLTLSLAPYSGSLINSYGDYNLVIMFSIIISFIGFCLSLFFLKKNYLKL